MTTTDYIRIDLGLVIDDLTPEILEPHGITVIPGSANHRLPAGTITRSQLRSLNHLIRDWRKQHEFSKAQVEVTSVELSPTEYGKLWVYLRTYRTDCDEYSPRFIFTEVRGSLTLGTMGGRVLWDYRNDISSDQKYVRKMRSLQARILHAALAPLTYRRKSK
jgi:hypothetical protein